MLVTVSCPKAGTARTHRQMERNCNFFIMTPALFREGTTHNQRTRWETLLPRSTLQGENTAENQQQLSESLVPGIVPGIVLARCLAIPKHGRDIPERTGVAP